MKRLFVILSVLLSAALSARAQNTALSVNVGDAAVLGTIGVNASQALHRNWTIDASGRWNPWTFRKGQDNQLQYRHQTYSLGARWWPWHVFSGWYVCSSAQYQEYSRGGFTKAVTEEGDACGMTFGFGYMHMLSSHWNFSVGASGWAGYTWYKTYSCPNCGRRTGEGGKGFILPNEVVLGFSYIF